MVTFRQKLKTTRDFVIGAELVTTRGMLTAGKAAQVRSFGLELAALPGVDWISITDNAGGNPMLGPAALGQPILRAGKDVMIHLSCKDFNRNGLESEAWLLANEGFTNILALSGDSPARGIAGHAKPVFDTDSVGLLTMLQYMNNGLMVPKFKGAVPQITRLAPASFFPGAVTTNFKLRENEWAGKVTLDGVNAAQVSADGVDAVTADGSVAGDDQISGISLEPLHQAALPALVGTEPAAGGNRLAQLIAGHNPPSTDGHARRHEKAQRWVEGAADHAGHRSEGEQVEQLAASEVGCFIAAGWGKGTGVDHGELIQWLRTYNIVGLSLVRDSRCALFRHAPVDAHVDDPWCWVARAHQDWLWVR